MILTKDPEVAKLVGAKVKKKKNPKRKPDDDYMEFGLASVEGIEEFC